MQKKKQSTISVQVVTAQQSRNTANEQKAINSLQPNCESRRGLNHHPQVKGSSNKIPLFGTRHNSFVHQITGPVLKSPLAKKGSSGHIFREKKKSTVTVGAAGVLDFCTRAGQHAVSGQDASTSPMLFKRSISGAGYEERDSFSEEDLHVEDDCMFMEDKLLGNEASNHTDERKTEEDPYLLSASGKISV